MDEEIMPPPNFENGVLQLGLDRIYSAWELCADWSWTKDYDAMIVGGRVAYDVVQVSLTMQTVQLSRISAGDTHNDRPRTVIRYVKPETPMRLIHHQR